jgi:protein phosphatase
MKLITPELSLVVLIGPSGSGKSTFARRHFKTTEILSSDFCRGLVSNDENNQAATDDAFDVLHYIAAKRLERGLLTVVDATNLQEESRKPLIDLAKKYHVLPVAIVFKLPDKLIEERNRSHNGRNLNSHVIDQHCRLVRKTIKLLKYEGFRYIYTFNSVEEIETSEIERQPLWTNRRTEHGPFDIIGDIHGCFDELKELIRNLGYVIQQDEQNKFCIQHPQNRKLIFLGDLVDRGPKTPEVLRLTMDAVESGMALCVPGNHDTKLLKKLRGKDVRITHGLAESLSQLEKEPPEFLQRVCEFIDKLIGHYVLDDGKLVVAHAGMKQEYQGRGSARVREFALYGETTGETDEFGLPVRYDWAADYRGSAIVVYGHTPVPQAEWLNRTINIDTGCVFGGRLTALRYPEKELMSVPAKHTYYDSVKPFLPEDQQAPVLTAQQHSDDLLEIEDVIGKRIITTQLHHTVTIREENAIAALEVMSRFAVNPKWLIYLPPTMSPSETTSLPDLLEHPSEAFTYFLKQGVGKVICEEKHMGSRAIVIVCRDSDVARKRFGIADVETGIVYTRTGRPFFSDKKMENELLSVLKQGITSANLWQEQNTDWFCIDCELMPWSAKAQELIKSQYASVGCAGSASLKEVAETLRKAGLRLQEAGPFLDQTNSRIELIEKFKQSYRNYCWPVNSLNDLRLAPFHLLATENHVHTNKDHKWHMNFAAKMSEAMPGIVIPTSYQVVDVTDKNSIDNAISWWSEKTSGGYEGMVVKPLDFVAFGKRGLVQPGLKVRGREYLRIIYGPEYTTPQNLERLRTRGLATKRALALREFALGIEALERFIRREPLRRVHECVFGVLALESEPVDPRL